MLKFRSLNIPDVILIGSDIFYDHRGLLTEFYNYSLFKDLGINKPFLQFNHSKSKKAVLRGLHYQLIPKSQAKLIKVVTGKIYDVVVDLRKGSPFYGKWEGVYLDSNSEGIYVPEGFAHGFCTLSDETDVIYCLTEYYDPLYERGIIWNDPILNIDWPIKEPVLSPKDENLPLLKYAENNFIYKPV
ncbi:MAG: dTDP-4-dehydrorhamnose 3,5-epimerase [Candidatus Omnitrophica bacterium]|nr:dTDP-4-dehydrorhamnose 3,5-epimerase [Candidatus Omnitrophota bacterium]